MTRDPHVSIEDLSRVLADDPVLAAKLLRLANSSLFRHGEPVTTLVEAATRLGLGTVKVMALSFALAEALPRITAKPSDLSEYWRASLVTTVAARSLARLARSPFEDEAFLCGLLSRIGELVLEQCMPDRWQEVMVRGTGVTPPIDLQRELLGVDHAEIGARLLEAWELPAAICQAVRWQVSPEAMPADMPAAIRELARTLHTASAVAEFICSDGDSRHLMRIEALTDRFYGLASGEVDAFVVALESGIVETSMLLNARLPAVESYDTLLARARRQLLEASLATPVEVQPEESRSEAVEPESERAGPLDPLTGLSDRDGFDAYLREAVEDRIAKRVGTPLALLMIDIDHFKQFNDSHGHDAGDEALRSVARAIESCLRAGSLAGRCGGDAFGVVLPGCGIANLEAVAERIRLRVAEQAAVIDGRTVALSVTIGGACAQLVRGPRDERGLVARAGDCLEEAKHAGGNCTVCREVGSNS